MFQPQFHRPMQRQRCLKTALSLACLVTLSACLQQSPLVALGLEPGIKANSHTRLRFPAHTPVLIRFDATQTPQAWEVAAHQGVAMHFPHAQRQQTQSHGLEWFVRWPYVEPPVAAPVPVTPTATLQLSANPEAPAQPSAWYSYPGAKRRIGDLVERLPNPLFWRRDTSAVLVSEPLPPRVRGLAQVVVSDRANGKILALADVLIDESAVVRFASHRRNPKGAPKRRASNERQIAKAFAALAASLVASGDS